MWYFLIFPVIFVLWRVYRFGGVWQIISSLAYIAVSGGISIGILKKLYNADCSRFNTICIRSAFPIRFMSG